MPAGKVDLDNVESWAYEGDLEAQIEVYSIIANNSQLAMNIKVVMLYNPKIDKHILYSAPPSFVHFISATVIHVLPRGNGLKPRVFLLPTTLRYSF
jgi:hypothetical protein